jgi:hypothetical protein
MAATIQKSKHISCWNCGKTKMCIEIDLDVWWTEMAGKIKIHEARERMNRNGTDLKVQDQFRSTKCDWTCEKCIIGVITFVSRSGLRGKG